MSAVLERRHPLQKRLKVLGGSANTRLDTAIVDIQRLNKDHSYFCHLINTRECTTSTVILPSLFKLIPLQQHKTRKSRETQQAIGVLHWLCMSRHSTDSLLQPGQAAWLHIELSSVFLEVGNTNCPLCIWRKYICMDKFHKCNWSGKILKLSCASLLGLFMYAIFIPLR